MNKELDLRNANGNSDKYSIYNYLKKTPSFLIAVGSAIVAVITFLAKLMTNIEIRKILTLWNIDISSVDPDNSALIFTSLLHIFYLIFTTSIMICVNSMTESYIPVRKSRFANKCCKKILKSSKKSNKYKKYEECVKNHKKLKILFVFLHFLKLTVAFIATFVVNIIYFYISISESKYLFVAALVSTALQFTLFYLLSRLNFNSINKKEIRNDCKKENYQKYIALDDSSLEHSNKSISKNLTNSNIVIFIAQTISVCLIICIISIFLPTEGLTKNSNVQIVSLDEKDYCVVYQSNGKYFMKETETIVNEENNKRILIIYTDKQKIYSSDVLDVQIKKYDDIEILGIGEDYK